MWSVEDSWRGRRARRRSRCLLSACRHTLQRSQPEFRQDVRTDDLTLGYGGGGLTAVAQCVTVNLTLLPVVLWSFRAIWEYLALKPGKFFPSSVTSVSSMTFPDDRKDREV